MRRSAALVGLCMTVVFSMQCQQDTRVVAVSMRPAMAERSHGTEGGLGSGGGLATGSIERSPASTRTPTEVPTVTAKAAPAPEKDTRNRLGSTASIERTPPPSQAESEVVLASNQQPFSTAKSQVDEFQASVSEPPAAGEHEDFAQRDALGFLKFCLEKYKTDIRDYRCTFTKLERILGELKPEQIADVRFRDQPFSVDMTFTKNIADCKRALYVADKWLDDEGNQQAWAKPGGAIVRLLISKILQPIHGSRAKKASRRTIDQFGFGKSFELIIFYCEKAEADDAFSLSYVGQGSIGGRPTYKFERILPYDGDESNYPDHLLVFHIDQETLLPTACYAYSDSAGEQLLGSYIYTDVVLNPGYVADDFDPDIINF